MRYLAIVPARGGSKGIPGKNLRLIHGKPLIAYTLEVAMQAPGLDRLIVSTDDAEIEKTCADMGVEVLQRPASLARDETPTLPVLQHAVEELEKQGDEFDAVVTLQPTSPLREVRHINEALSLFESNSAADSLVSCVPVPHIFHPVSVMQKGEDGFVRPYLDGGQTLRRQDKVPVLARNGAAIYITRRDCLSEFVFGGNLLAYMMDEESSVDIDTAEDLELVGKLLEKRCP